MENKLVVLHFWLIECRLSECVRDKPLRDSRTRKATTTRLDYDNSCWVMTNPLLR